MRALIIAITLVGSSTFSHAFSLSYDSVSGRSPYLDSLEALSLRANTATSQKVDLLNMVGRLYTERDMEKAKSILHLSSSLADSLHYSWGKVQACKQLGIINDYQGYIAVAATYFNKAIALLKQDTTQRSLAERLFIESYPAGRVILGPLTTQYVMPRDSTIAYLLKCIDIKTRLNDALGAADAYDRLAHEYWDRAINEHTTDDFKKAADAWKDEVKEYSKANFPDGVAVATGKVGVGIYYLGDSIGARNYFRKAFRMHRRSGNLLYQARNLINLGYMSISWSQPDSAKYYFKAAVDIATKLKLVDVMHMGYLELANLYKAEGNYKMVSECYFTLFKSRDLHFSQAHLVTTSEMKSQYEDQIKADQIKRLELENQLKEDQLSQRYLLILFLTTLTVVLIVGGYLFLRSRRRYLAKINAIETSHRIKYEKDRISKELHDNIGTRLTTLTLSLRELERKSTISSPVMELIRNDVQTVIAELRDSIWAINEHEITLEEFGDKVRNVLWRAQQDNPLLNCKVSLITDQPRIRLKPHVAINLFRIVQEAVANSLKHSGASELTIVLTYEPTAKLNVIISDNGRGFPTHDGEKSGLSYGLHNMQSRAEDIGASFNVTSNHGTSITLNVTLQNGN